MKCWILIFEIIKKWKDTLNVKLIPPAGGSKPLSRCDLTESFKRLIHSGAKHLLVAQSAVIVLGMFFFGGGGGGGGGDRAKTANMVSKT